ncbi:aminotransferase class IV [Flavihumibacter fluvii]|uniref:aminotransferase class IV n=1 Tax=Flavihumibacter fluvii TaxID=2838157 RepID=UPI001BDDECF9|nr:aminotransferase class IV [Flavihumibacter fluvii]ULQ53003.1 aminotransferase class IV [Flavihumibacter fluvii]
MSSVLFHDGQFFRDDKMLVGAGSRGLRYGDGVFETMKVNRGTIQLGSQHMDRLFAALQLLEFDCPGFFTSGYLLDKIKVLATRNGHASLGRIRLMVYRGNGGLYDPENHYPHHIIQSWALPPANHQWNENGMLLGIHRKAQKAADVLANCKTNNYLPYVMGALEAKRQKWNDALLMNTSGRVCEATIANIFLIQDRRLVTPSLPEGPVAGIMRQYLVRKITEYGYDLSEQPVTEEQLLGADEVFLTNSSYGIRWVGEIGAKKYTSHLTRAIYQEIIQPLFLSPSA